MKTQTKSLMMLTLVVLLLDVPTSAFADSWISRGGNIFFETFVSQCKNWNLVPLPPPRCTLYHPSFASRLSIGIV